MKVYETFSSFGEIELQKFESFHSKSPYFIHYCSFKDLLTTCFKSPSGLKIYFGNNDIGKKKSVEPFTSLEYRHKFSMTNLFV